MICINFPKLSVLASAMCGKESLWGVEDNYGETFSFFRSLSYPLTFFFHIASKTSAIHLMRSHFLCYRKNARSVKFMLFVLSTTLCTATPHLGFFCGISSDQDRKGEASSTCKAQRSLKRNRSNPIISSRDSWCARPKTPDTWKFKVVKVRRIKSGEERFQ